MSESRTAAFRRNTLLEQMLTELNADLQASEAQLIAQQSGAFPYPLILIMGPLRSGTTLFMQWLANTGLVAYPSNLLSRFYHAPILGAKIQLLLTDQRYNFRDELGEFLQQADYSSENGKTRGVLAPNEFWYFWRRFLADATRDIWTDEELHQNMDVKTMKAELAGMMEVFQKPFAAKGMLFNYNIPFLNAVFDRVLFVQIRRDPIDNVASVLKARERQLGREDAWYSFRIPEYEKLKGLGPLEQAAGQVSYINAAVTRGLQKVAEERKLVVHYEEFCQQPATVFERLVQKLDIQADYGGPSAFTPTPGAAHNQRETISTTLERFINLKETT